MSAGGQVRGAVAREPWSVGMSGPRAEFIERTWCIIINDGDTRFSPSPSPSQHHHSRRRRAHMSEK